VTLGGNLPKRGSAVAAPVLLLLILISLALMAGQPQTPHDAVPFNGSTYHEKAVRLAPCSSGGNATPPATERMYGFEFAFYLRQCFSPGGLVLAGNVTDPEGATSNYTLSARQVRDSDGLVSWISQDGKSAVRWDGSYQARLLTKES